jgi:osomolarity two-component system response regulator SKN7
MAKVWEFQHPHFQAGSRADLDSIKRKAVVPKKAVENENDTSPRGGVESVQRMNEMEQRILMLEDRLVLALDEVREARAREMGMVTITRELVGHLSHIESSKQFP